MLFDLQVSERDGGKVLAVTGELDLATVPQVRQAVVELLASSNGVPMLVLDLSGVDFIDSSGLGSVLGAMRRARAANGEVRAVVCAPHVRSLFEITGLDRLLPVHGSVDEAVAATEAGTG